MKRYLLKTYLPYLNRPNKHQEITLTLSELIEYIQAIGDCGEYVEDIDILAR